MAKSKQSSGKKITKFKSQIYYIPINHGTFFIFPIVGTWAFSIFEIVLCVNTVVFCFNFLKDQKKKKTHQTIQITNWEIFKNNKFYKIFTIYNKFYHR